MVTESLASLALMLMVTSSPVVAGLGAVASEDSELPDASVGAGAVDEGCSSDDMAIYRRMNAGRSSCGMVRLGAEGFREEGWVGGRRPGTEPWPMTRIARHNFRNSCQTDLPQLPIRRRARPRFSTEDDPRCEAQGSHGAKGQDASRLAGAPAHRPIDAVNSGRCSRPRHQGPPRRPRVRL